MKKSFEFRVSTLAEREEFYRKEFSLSKVKKWFKKNEMKTPQVCALDAGSETGIIIDKKFRGKMLYFPFSKLKEKIIKYLPEDLYYDRNFYKNPSLALKKLNFNNFLKQELVFDIDSDNIPCKNHKKEQVCSICLQKAFASAFKIKKELLKEFNKIIIVYSGRGFHVHVLDKKAYCLSFKERDKFSKKLAKFPVDPWVSRGHIRLIRMPFSLNGLVSRKVIQISEKDEKNKKINLSDSIPGFMRR